MFKKLWNNLSLYKNFSLRSSSWPKLRKQHLKNNPTCAACGRSSNLEVHHIIPVHIDANKELDSDNLITLCDNTCHFIFGHLCNYTSWNSEVIDDCKKYLKKVKTRPYK